MSRNRSSFSPEFKNEMMKSHMHDFAMTLVRTGGQFLVQPTDSSYSRRDENQTAIFTEIIE